MIEKKSVTRIGVGNVNVPDYTTELDATMCMAMRKRLLKVLQSKSHDLSQTEIRSRALSYLPKDLYWGGKKNDLWSIATQLDLDAKGILVRENWQTSHAVSKNEEVNNSGE